MVTVFPAMAPGFKVQFPAGRLIKSTLPFEKIQVGCVIELTAGAGGVAG